MTPTTNIPIARNLKSKVIANDTAVVEDAYRPGLPRDSDRDSDGADGRDSGAEERGALTAGAEGADRGVYEGAGAAGAGRGV